MNEDDQDKLELYINGYKEFGDVAALTTWQRGFMDDQITRLEEWGPRMRLSEKQWACLEQIYAALPL